MDCRVLTETVGDVQVVHISGRMTLTTGYEIVDSEVDDLLQRGATKIVLEMGTTTGMDIHGLDLLVKLGVRAPVKIANPSDEVARVMHANDLGAIVDILPTVEEAITSFSKSRRSAGSDWDHPGRDIHI